MSLLSTFSPQVVNDGGMRQEIEIGILTNNTAKFIGSVKPKEVKFTIYKACLGFKDFSNFDGMRFGYCDVPTVTFSSVIMTKSKQSALVMQQYYVSYPNYRTAFGW